jgi:transcriptional regulator
MYLPAHFTETEAHEIARLIADFPLAMLVADTAEGLVANHIPMQMHDGRLVGHIARANDLHRSLADGAPVLAVFRGGDAYVSPNWYPSKQDHHRHVPTWNYQVVHVNGRITFRHDDKAKRAVVGRLTRAMEERTNGDAAWRMADAPRDYLSDMLDNIVAFEIEVTKVIAKSKLSQNRTAEDFDNVVRVLGERGEDRIAASMARIRDAE